MINALSVISPCSDHSPLESAVNDFSSAVI